MACWAVSSPSSPSPPPVCEQVVLRRRLSLHSVCNSWMPSSAGVPSRITLTKF
jgi:hypothetical protein